MLFNSLEFLLFLPLVFAAYWLLRNHLRLQNLLVVIVSYVFYGWWDWRFLTLIGFTSGWAYVFGLFELRGEERSAAAKWRLALSCLVNLGILAYFKYYNFFIGQFVSCMDAMGVHCNPYSLKIILPVGISFYTFQALSYTIDVYKRTIVPTKDPIAFCAYISFFPQLVAGPIERATNLLPQFLKKRTFDYALAVEGGRQMLWGFLKKVFVADSCAYVANQILGNPHASSISLWVGVIAFAFQIYGDFSGYSDIAIGCSKLFGIRLMRNFAYPYFSRDIAEFWRRWHISLTTWFRDYIYIPLGGSRCGLRKKIANTFVVFFVSGFWHGANWTFIVWGAFHAACFMPLMLLNRNRKHVADIVAEDRMIPNLHEVLSMVITFAIVVVGWAFFRAPDIGMAGDWVWKMVSFSDLAIKERNIGAVSHMIFPILFLVVIEWLSRRRPLPILPRSRVCRWVCYVGAVVLMLAWRSTPQSFIYFQF